MSVEPAAKSDAPHALTTAEILAKATAAVAAMSLGAAFLFDSIQWLIVADSVLDQFTVSDHIQTAISIVPFITAYVAYTIFFARWLIRSRVLASVAYTRVWWKSLTFDLFMTATAAVLSWMFFSPSEAFYGILTPPFFQQNEHRVVACIILVVATVVALAIERRIFAYGGLNDVRVLGLPARYVIGVGAMGIVGVVTVALLSGMAMAYGTYRYAIRTDRVFVDQANQFTGRILRQLDKGVVLKIDQRIVFIPKDQVKRIEYGI